MMDKQLRDKLQPYHDAGYVFKSCSDEWIVVLGRRSDTRDNEKRVCIDSKYAKFRGSEFDVIDIVNKFDETNTITSIDNTFYEEKTVEYTIGETVKPDSYDDNYEIVCSHGIHYFKSYEAAFYYELTKIHDGVYKKWYDDGQLHIECTYLNGAINGLCQEWCKDGQLKNEHIYKNGIIDGSCHKSSKNKHTYKNGFIDGSCHVWYDNGMYFINYIPSMEKIKTYAKTYLDQ